MSVMLANLKFSKRILQPCPLCDQENPIILRGFIKDLQDETKTVISTDKGYSFCNCNNIYYTSWKNINQDVYNSDYIDKYTGIEHIIAKYGDVYIPEFKKLQDNRTGKFLEVGSINDGLLDETAKAGYESYGLEMTKRDSKHKIIPGDFEKIHLSNRYDIVFVSHVFEHFKDPVKAIEKCHHILADDGLLFVAMPDPYFIDYSYVYSWGHWHVEEHHIMWDMESFIDVVESKGFTCELKHRNTGSKGFICWGDFHLIFKKRG